MEKRLPMNLPALGRARPTTAAALVALLFLSAACTTPVGPSATDGSAKPPIAATAEPPAPKPAESATQVVIAAAPPVADTPAPQPVPVDPLRPGVRLDLDDRASQTDLWARVRAGFAMPDLDSDLVHNREQWYATRPDYVQRMTQRGGRYLFHIVEELERRRMPSELALLPFIESAFNPQAISTAKASGMWQFMSATGRDFSLKQNVFRDDRRDVLASTRAALDYLQRLHAQFGDWHLALAAYNWGEGNVQRAIAKNQKLGLATDYASLSMPNETQYYVPKLQAVKNIVARPADFALELPPLRNHPYFLSVPIERDMDVDVAVRLAGIRIDEFQTLNPQMNKPVILAAGTPQILLPYDNANQFVRALPSHRGPLASWTAWIAPKTVHPGEAARQVGMSEAELRAVNHIPARMLVKAGSTLLVPRSEQRLADVSATVADNASLALAPDLPPLKKVALRAGRRDSVASVALRYHLAPAQVAQWNATSAAAAFRPGQTIVVFVPQKTRVAHTQPGNARSTILPIARVNVSVANDDKAAAPVPPTTSHAAATRAARSHLTRQASASKGAPSASTRHAARRAVPVAGARSAKLVTAPSRLNLTRK
jgi:membrane-bound lytic murein transglycosylase D